MVVLWRSQQQNSVTLSSTKAEYINLPEVATEILFYQEFIVFYGLEITHPIIVNMNNIGVPFDFRWGHRREKHVGVR